MNNNVLPMPIHDEPSKKFMNWLDNSKPGDKYCYYVGAFLSGTGRSVGRIAFRAFEKGAITLYQKRAGTAFEYWAVRQRWR